MLIGNDIIDLRGESETHHPRFARRVLTEEEYREYRQSPNPRLHVWRAWAAKEAAYKLAMQDGEPCPFRPTAFEYRPAEQAVRHSGKTISVAVTDTPEYVAAVAVAGDDRPLHVVASIDTVMSRQARKPHHHASQRARESCAARIVLKECLARRLQCSAHDLVIERTSHGIPIACLRGRRLPVGVTISHHGRFVSVAAAFPRDLFP